MSSSHKQRIYNQMERKKERRGRWRWSLQNSKSSEFTATSLLLFHSSPRIKAAMMAIMGPNARITRQQQVVVTRGESMSLIQTPTGIKFDSVIIWMSPTNEDSRITSWWETAPHHHQNSKRESGKSLSLSFSTAEFNWKRWKRVAVISRSGHHNKEWAEEAPQSN